MQVWVLFRGTRHEGGQVLGVYEDEEDARDALKDQYDRQMELRPDDSEFQPEWVDEDEFESGCDYHVIFPEEVQ